MPDWLKSEFLRVDRKKGDHVNPARKWALDLIAANAGKVKLSPEARAELLNRPLDFGSVFDTSTPDFDMGGDRSSGPQPRK